MSELLNKTKLVVGPPGTGKTTTLLNICDDLMRDAIPPQQIAYIAFTRKAANEAKYRAMEKFKLPSEALPWFRTLHSLAFQRLGIQRSQVLGLRDYITIAGGLGLHITCKGIAEDGTLMGFSKGDRLFFTEMMARARIKTLKEYWEMYPNEDIYWYELERLAETLKLYKSEQGKIDFIDMIYKFLAEPNVPEIEALIVDEAQDLSTIQWQMVKILAASAKKVFIAGDDDQAIFRWAGADVEAFQTFPNYEMVVLPHSYRVPKLVLGVAESIISRCENRIAKQWTPRPEQGSIQFVSDLDQIDMSKGTWLLLARNTYLLEQYNQFCIRAGWVFDSVLGSPVKASTIEAIRIWEHLRKGGDSSIAGVKKVYEMMGVKVGVSYGSKAKLDRVSEETMVTLIDLRKNYGLLVETIWHEAFDRMPLEERQYFIAALKNGEKLLKEPRIKINTIHGVKGGEADNVVIVTDMAQRTFHEYHENPDDEHRVWYVAVTRAKENLFVMEPRTKMCYPF
jgi:DNA helicase II / ATP-dependent DNA helicase PcrA